MIPTNILRLLSNIRSTASYKGDLSNKHFSVALVKGKIISPVVNNYHRVNVFGTLRGSLHAEMATMNYVLSSKTKMSMNKSYFFINKKWEEQWSEAQQRKEKVAKKD